MDVNKILVFIVVLALAVLVGYLVRVPLMDQSQQMHNGVRPLNGKSPGQSFVAARDNLYRLDVLVASENRFQSGRLVLLLGRDFHLSPVIRRVAVPAERITNNRYLSFVFEPIGDSKDKSFYFRLVPEDFEAKGVYVWFYSSEEAYPLGTGFLGTGKLGGDLQFSSFSRTSLIEAIRTVFTAVAEHKPFPLDLASLYVVLVGVYLLLTAFLLARVLSARY